MDSKRPSTSLREAVIKEMRQAPTATGLRSLDNMARAVLELTGPDKAAAVAAAYEQGVTDAKRVVEGLAGQVCCGNYQAEAGCCGQYRHGECCGDPVPVQECCGDPEYPLPDAREVIPRIAALAVRGVEANKETPDA